MQGSAQNVLYDFEHMVFNSWSICQSTGRSADVQPDAACRLFCFEAGTAEAQHGGIVSGRAETGPFGRTSADGSLPNAEIAVLHAERRQLTVVFVDIVGSTPLSEQIDPEEFFAVIRTYRDICNGQISQYGGHIARMIGDGLLAYFGVPQAHENDPERAVRASLAIAAAVKEHQFPLRMAASSVSVCGSG